MRREPTFLPRLVVGAFVAGAAAITLGLGGCGSRGPLDDYATNVTSSDAATESGSSTADDAGGQSTPVVDAGREASAISCGTCVVTTCGKSILACLQSAPCRTVFQCVATTCLGAGGGSGGGGGGSGGINPVCLFQCANGDPAGALGVLSVFQCVTSDCGSDCGSLLGGLAGGAGGGKGPGGGGKGAAETEAFREIFSPWPELFSPVDAPVEPRAPR